MMYVKLVVFCVLICTSCTISMTNVSTEGTASDVVDETQANTPSTSVTASVPAVAL